eukprot:322734_1
MMSTVEVIRYAQPAEIALATFAIEKGTQLFFSRFDTFSNEQNENEQIINIVFVESSNKHTKTKSKTNYGQKINETIRSLTESTDTALKEIETIKKIIEGSDFQQSLDYMSDAWRALSGKNINLFKQKINKAYDCARAAKTKITKNPNHLLGVYSILIFTGFCQFSEFGNDIILGLQHISDTLNQLNSEQLLIKNLKSVTTSKVYWDKDQKIFFENVLLFAVKVRCLVYNVIQYSLRNNNMNNMHMNDEKNEGSIVYHEEFGDVIKSLFPNAVIDMNQNKISKLLKYTEWTPNIFDGRYFGGNKAKTFAVIDFFKCVYPIIFQKRPLKDRRIFIEIYSNQLTQYLCKSSLARIYFKNVVDNTDENDVFCALNGSLDGKTKIALIFALHDKICNFEVDDSQKLNIPNKIIFSEYDHKFDTILISPFVNLQSIHFDGCNECAVHRFAYLLKFERAKQQLLSLKEFSLSNIYIQSKYLNVLLLVLNAICPNVIVFNMNNVKIQCDMNDISMWNDGFNLQFIPKSVTQIQYKTVKTGVYENKEDDNDEDSEHNDTMSKLNALCHKKLTETLPYLNSVCIDNISMDSKRLNSLFQSLSNSCNNIKILQLKSLNIHYNLQSDNNDNWFDIELDLDLLPKSIEIFEYKNITHSLMRDG